MSKKPPAAAPGHIKDLKFQPKNARKHNPRNIGLIADSLNDVGAARSIVIDEDNVILAGNGTIEAAAEAGITGVRVVEASGNEIIAVRRTGLTAKQKQRLAIADNRAQDLSEFDADILREIASTDDGDVLAGMFSTEEIDALLEEQAAARIEPFTVDQPTDLVWVLVGMPLTEWPKHQAAVESLQSVAVFTSQVLRPKDGDAVERSKAQAEERHRQKGGRRGA